MSGAATRQEGPAVPPAYGGTPAAGRPPVGPEGYRPPQVAVPPLAGGRPGTPRGPEGQKPPKQSRRSRKAKKGAPAFGGRGGNTLKLGQPSNRRKLAKRAGIAALGLVVAGTAANYVADARQQSDRERKDAEAEFIDELRTEGSEGNPTHATVFKFPAGTVIRSTPDVADGRLWDRGGDNVQQTVPEGHVLVVDTPLAGQGEYEGWIAFNMSGDPKSSEYGDEQGADAIGDHLVWVRMEDVPAGMEELTATVGIQEGGIATMDVRGNLVVPGAEQPVGVGVDYTIAQYDFQERIGEPLG